jgi:hypothetical protein
MGIEDSHREVISQIVFRVEAVALLLQGESREREETPQHTITPIKSSSGKNRSFVPVRLIPDPESRKLSNASDLPPWTVPMVIELTIFC